MGQPTPRQSQIDTQIAQYKQQQQEEEVRPVNHTNTQITSSTDGKIEKKFQDHVIIHYTHENRFITMKKDMHEIFRHAFKDLGIEAVRLIVGHRNSKTIQRELIRKRPPMKLMTTDNTGNISLWSIKTITSLVNPQFNNKKYFISDFQ